MILTITPNPSLDLLFTSDDELRWDDANRLAEPRRRPGGQGINLTRAALALGGRSVALALLGGRTGEMLAADLAAEGTPLRRVPLDAETRTFVAVRERVTGRSLLVNSRGPGCDAQVGDRLLDAVADAVATLRPTWVVSSGSLPPGLAADLHARIGERARREAARFVADCDGDALRIAATRGVCDLLVPNRHEARRLAGVDPHDVASAAEVARALRAYASSVVIKLGELGAVAVAADGAWHAVAAPVTHGSAVGAGDAFLAALLLAMQARAPLDHALADAVATGTAALHSTGATLIDPATVARIRAATGVTPIT